MTAPDLHAEDHLPGGRDPIDIPIGSVPLASISSGTTTVTTPWTVNTVPHNTAMNTTDSENDVFAKYTDGNSVIGISLLQEGVYAIQLSFAFSFAVNTGTRMLPTYVRMRTLWVTGSGNFSSSNGITPVLQHLTGSPVYLPDDTDGVGLSTTNQYSVSRIELFNLIDANTGDQTVPVHLAYSLQSLGGTEDWKYLASMVVARLGDTEGIPVTQ